MAYKRGGERGEKKERKRRERGEKEERKRRERGEGKSVLQVNPLPTLTRFQEVDDETCTRFRAPSRLDSAIGHYYHYNSLLII